MKYSPNLGGGKENFYNYTTNDNKNVCFNKNGTYVYTLYFKILCKTNWISLEQFHISIFSQLPSSLH